MTMNKAAGILNINARQFGSQMKDTIDTGYPEGFVQVAIRSSANGHMQPAVFYKTGSPGKKPLIVSLHSWSGDYMQKDPLAPKIKERDWNYIHPDFRGPNNTPGACGSPLVVSDIEDAIDFAINNARVNEQQIHIIGGSGGAHATLLCYMNIRHRVNSFSAWNPISNLVDWYYESLGRDSKYAEDIWKTTCSEGSLNTEEARRRSPVFMEHPGKMREDAKLFIYHGIHDGYLGSVPITQSLNFYNELVRKIDPMDERALIPRHDITDLLVKRCYPGSLSGSEMVGDRKVHYRRNYMNIQIIIFEGRHEMLNQVTFELIPAAVIH